MKVNINLPTLLVLVGLVAVIIIVLAPSEKVPGANDAPAYSGADMSSHHGGAPADDTLFKSLIGKPAPSINLLSYSGETVNLASLRGKKVVLFFNEGLMCYPACWNQVAALGKDERLNKDDVVAFSIVVDPKEGWSRAVERVPDLARAKVLFDTDHSVSNSYGVLTLPSSMHPGQLPGHTFVVIDKEGVIKFVFDDPMMGIRNDELLKEINKLS